MFVGSDESQVTDTGSELLCTVNKPVKYPEYPTEKQADAVANSPV
jgi:hypothetical protein